MSSAFAASLTPLPVEPDAAFVTALGTGGCAVDGTIAHALGTAAAVSPFLRDLMLADRDRLARLLSSDWRAIVAEAATPPVDPDIETVGRSLRERRATVALAAGLADLLGDAPLPSVCKALSDFADGAISCALESLVAAAGGTGSDGLVVLALGKLGACELNYSSDVDLIVLVDPTRARLDVNGAVRLTRRLVRLLQERTEHGYVFRVDLRLRPDPGSTPVAVSTVAALRYYQSRARAWERQAMIKARQVAGDVAVGERFMRALEPTLWPASFDFTAIEEVFETRERIAMVRGAGAITVPEHDVKLGRGGIREAEFFVQSLQRLAGGRDPRLRFGGTVDMLAELTRAGWITADVRDELTAAYNRLRRIEHRLQMIADEQTHTLPDERGLPTIAAMMREADFVERTVATLTTVHRQFTSLPERVAPRGDPHLAGAMTAREADEAVRERLSRALATLKADPPPSLRTARACALLDAIEVPLADAVATTADPDAAVAGICLFLQRLPGGVGLLARLEANRDLVRVLVLIVAATPRLAEELARRARLLDVLIDPVFFGSLPDRDALAAQLDRVLRAAPNYEARLDAMRRFGREQGLLVHVRTLAGSLAATATAAALTRLAEVLVGAGLDAASEEFAATHGRLEGGRVAVLALGSFASAEMTAMSDLDLIVVYDAAPEAGESDGRRPLTPGHYYNRLTQRLIAALSAPTAEGSLYEVDLRLRPSGRAGPVASHIRAFERYQDEGAWTWERMALTRARFVAGDGDLAGRALAAIDAGFTKGIERERLTEDVLTMRGKLAGHESAGLKHGPGGQIDVEFIAQHRQLAAGRRVALEGAGPGNVTDVLRALGEAGELPGSAVERLADAYGLFRGQAQLLALASAKQLLPNEAPAALQPLLVRAGDAPDMDFLVADVAERRREVRALFEELIGPVPPAP